MCCNVMRTYVVDAILGMQKLGEVGDEVRLVNKDLILCRCLRDGVG